MHLEETKTIWDLIHYLIKRTDLNEDIMQSVIKQANAYYRQGLDPSKYLDIIKDNINID